MHDLLVGGPVATAARTLVALGPIEHLLVRFLGVDSPFHTCHFIPPGSSSTKQLLCDLGVSGSKRDLSGPAPVGVLAFGETQMPASGLASHVLAGTGDLDPLLGATVCLHLGHGYLLLLPLLLLRGL